MNKCIQINETVFGACVRQLPIQEKNIPAASIIPNVLISMKTLSPHVPFQGE